MTETITRERTALAAIPIYFGPESRRLFGWYHPAAKPNPSATAIVLCKPIGYEALCAHAYYRYLAERLASEGYPVLRFDYDGTGDSYGSDDDPNRVENWVASIGFAIDTLRARSGHQEISLFGVRLGATLATLAASQRGDVNSLVLWAACRGGRSYLREMRLLKAAHRGGNSAETELAPDSPSYEEAAGFFYTAETVERLQSLDATTIDRRPARRALVISRDDLPGDPHLLKRLNSLGTQTTSVAWSGYASMMRDPQDTEMPIPTVDSLLDWLSVGGEENAQGTTHLKSHFDDVKQRLEAPDYSEEPVITGDEPGVFGILTLPKKGGDASRPTVLLISVGANPHVGPNRMYVTLARRLAASGYAVLRLDVPGIGDSARGPDSARGHIYSDEASASVQALLQKLQDSRGTDRFVLIGLCSGAYAAYRVTTADSRVAGQILINPQTYEWHEGDSIEIRLDQSYKLTSHYTNSLLDPRTLKRIVLGQVDFRGIAGALWKRLVERIVRTAHGLAVGITKRRAFETTVCQDFRKISVRGTQTLFLFAEHDFGIEATAAHLGANARKMSRYKTVQYETVNGADHTFTPKNVRDRTIVRIQEYIETAFPATSGTVVKAKV